MRLVENVFWLFAISGALYGAVVIVNGLKAALSAPQEAAVISLGIAFAVIPYCIARAVSELARKD